MKNLTDLEISVPILPVQITENLRRFWTTLAV